VAACEIVARHDGMPVRDALHAATALRAGCDAIVSYDLDFDRIDSVRRLTPEAVTA
jgi:predicted nucleic acid-binding protein